MKTPARFIVSTTAVGALFLFLNGVGWAAVFLWKSEAIALACAIPAAILYPACAITVVPQSSLNTPIFFVLMMIFSFMIWGGIITLSWNRMKQGPQTHQMHTISNRADAV